MKLQGTRQEAASRTRRGGIGWALASAVAGLSVAAWLNDPRVQYLTAAVVATVAGLLLLPWLQGAQRRWALACTALLATVVAFGLGAQVELLRVMTRWDAYRAQKVSGALSRMHQELDGTMRDLQRSAQASLGAPSDLPSAFAKLEPLSQGRDERGLVLYDHGRPFAWSGSIRVATDSLREPFGVAPSAFYYALYASTSSGNRRAIATALLDAAPPGNEFAQPMSARVARATGVGGFQFSVPSAATPNDREVLRYSAGGRVLFDVRPLPLQQGEMLLRLKEQARIRVAVLLAAALACFIIAVWRGTRLLRWRLSALAGVLACAALAPLNEFSNFTRLFNPALYFTALGSQLTANAGALGITSAIALLAVMAVARRHARRSSPVAAVVVILLVAFAGPFLLRDLARGVRMPAYGVSASLWLIWEVPLFLAALSVLLAGATAGSSMLGRRRGLPPAVAPALATAAALLAPLVWQAPGQWPWWYTFLWIGAIVALALSRQTRFLIITSATVAALGATTLVWGRTARGRVELAETDLRGLRDPDLYALSLLDRLGAELRNGPPPSTRQALLQQFVVSDLAAAGYPTALFAFGRDSTPIAALQTASFGIPINEVLRGAAEARREGRPLLLTLAGEPANEFLLAVPSDSGVTAVVVAPRTRLIAADPFARLLGLEADPEAEPPYTVQLVEPLGAVSKDDRVNWRREQNELHGDLEVRRGGSANASRMHVEVELRPLDTLVQRGALITLLDLAIVGLLWLVSVLADGGVGRWLQARQRTWGRSFRARLTIALMGFFVIPAMAFAVWSYQQLSSDARQSRDLLVRETLRAASSSDSTPGWIDRESDRLDTPLLQYTDGQLQEASDPLYLSLAPMGRFLDPTVEKRLAPREEVNASSVEKIGSTPTLIGYRALHHPTLGDVVLAAPARADELTLGRRRRDLGVLVLFATVVGALAALWLSGIAARQLATPISKLRAAALAIAGGDREPLLQDEPQAEFRPVFAAFRRMAADLNASRSALEDAQRRTAAILRNVGSGVIGIDAEGRVSLANPRADALVGAPLPPRTVLAEVAPKELADRVLAFLRCDAEDDSFELESEGEQVRVQLTRLARGGAVITLDDVTALVRAQRVLAWGEMARQVAHEIKNPLTPIRLGVQHLRRARADTRLDYDKVLEQNVARILTEIDRLDEIARAFSRYGSAPEDRPPAAPTDVAAVVRDVLGLETMGGDGDGSHYAGDVRWELSGADAPVIAMARSDELREVLLNVFENARLAGAHLVRVSLGGSTPSGDGRFVDIEVADDGAGIAEDVLPRIFEPHFSTRTSGSGLGLAVSRRIIDGWGGEISVVSRVGEGTNVSIRLRYAEGSRGR